MSISRRLVLAIVLAVVAVFLIVFGIMRFIEYRQTVDFNEQNAKPTWVSMINQPYDHRTVDGVEYKYRPGIINVLLLGIDLEGELAKSTPNTAREGGQCDAIYLLTLDKINGTLDILQFDRDTITFINVLGPTGDSLGPKEDHLCLSHAYGKTEKERCENARDAVSNLLGGIRIDYYASMSIAALTPLVDAVGGVTVTCVTDLSHLDPELREGATVTLDGPKAELYVRSRMNADDGTNKSRLVRQKSFLNALLDEILKKLRNDFTDATKWYDSIQPYTYLSTSFENFLSIFEMSMNFTRSEMITPVGTYDYSKTYAEFHIDQDNLTQTVLRLCYKKVK